MSGVDKSAVLVLMAELARDQATIEALGAEFRRASGRIASGARDSLDYAALGYTIHNIYGLMENSFLRIAKTFENHIEGDRWHRDLVQRMTIQVEGMRPALLDSDAALLVDELRAFRHIFRNIYQTRLDPERVMAVARTCEKAMDAFGAATERFKGELRIILAG